METTTKIKEAISKTYSWKAELFWPVRKNQDSDFNEIDLFQLVYFKTSTGRRKKVTTDIISTKNVAHQTMAKHI